MGFQQEYVLAPRACRQHHSLGYSKAHFPGRQVCHHHRQLAHQVFRLIGLLDAGEYLAVVLPITQVEHQAQKLIGAFNVLGGDDSGDTQIHFGKIFKFDGLLLNVFFRLCARRRVGRCAR